MLLKEYRICMPLSVSEYRIGQLYMIAKHSQEQSDRGEGVEVVKNEEITDPVQGKGRYTEKRIHLSSIYIETRYEDNAGTSENCMNLCPEELEKREVDFIDIAYDQLPPKHYKESEDLTNFKSKKTDRGPLEKNWKEVASPLMCSYKVVKVRFEVLGFQGKVESFAHKSVRDILLLGHRQAFAWIDEWIDMTMEDLREYEAMTNEATNKKVLQA